MTRKTESEITFNITTNFPVAGQDNDTQTFRDNYDTIYSGLRYANEELTDIFVNGVFKDVDNDLNGTVTQNTYLQKVYDRKKLLSLSGSSQDIDFFNGHYQILDGITTGCSLTFSNFPTLNTTENGAIMGRGKVTIELYGTGTVTFVTSGATIFKKNGFPGASLVLSSAANPVIIEVWQHSSSVIYLNYVGYFS
jgi:hypothetical protein